MTKMDCRTCKHNTYKNIDDCEWVDCMHPITTDKTPKWEKGDPVMVGYRTGDVPISQIHNLQGCQTWESTQ